jgi:membrane-associated phospholipid phosphatase
VPALTEQGERPGARAPRRARLLTWAGLAVYAAGSALAFTRWNFLVNPDWIWAWVFLGLLAVSLSDLRGWARGVVRDWLPFMAMILAYDLLRGASDGFVSHPHAQPQLGFDKLVGGGELPTVALQNAYFDRFGHLQWWDWAAWAVYSTHFLVTVVVAAVLWRTQRERFRRFRTRVVTLAFAAIATFALYPTIPPWLAHGQGLAPAVKRVSQHVANHLDLNRMGALFHSGTQYANKVAAVPSLHAAYPMLLLLFFWSTGWAVRALLGTYVLAMGLAVVYVGEHFIFDVLVGWAYAGAIMVACAAASRAWERRRSSAAKAGPERVPAAVGR